MTKTTESQRCNAFDYGIMPDKEMAFIQDAYRLAQIERRVRELADRIESDAEPVLEDTECIVDELRAILDTGKEGVQ